jgi:hypothetical protein
MRDIPKALVHFDKFWQGASDLEKNRFAEQYARLLYEHHIYYEEDEAEVSSLRKLLTLGSEFLGTGTKKYFLSCYYGLALLLDNDANGRGQDESAFLDLFMEWLDHRLGGMYSYNREDYYQNLLMNTIYTSEFHNFIRGQASYIANSLLISLESPEIYNAIATYLLHTSKTDLSHKKLKPVKRLYDIAIALARSEEYYLPKYRFNRIRCDFLEIKSSVLTNHQGVFALVSIIDELHLLAPRFYWAGRCLTEEVCEYLHQHRDNTFVQQVVSHSHYSRYWGTLRKAMQRKANLPSPAEETELSQE